MVVPYLQVRSSRGLWGTVPLHFPLLFYNNLHLQPVDLGTSGLPDDKPFYKLIDPPVDATNVVFRIKPTGGKPTLSLDLKACQGE